MRTGWLGDGAEIPAAAEASRALDDVMRAAVAPTVAELRAGQAEARRRESAEADRRDAGEVLAWRGRGVTAGEVLAREDPVDLAQRSRVRRAREILREHGLDDVLPGCGPVLDANLGYLEPRRPRARKNFETQRAEYQQRQDDEARRERESAGVAAISRAQTARLAADPWANWGRCRG
jgi:hypothetical protein